MESTVYEMDNCVTHKKAMKGCVCPEGYGFSAVLVINRVSILADFGHFGHK